MAKLVASIARLYEVALEMKDLRTPYARKRLINALSNNAMFTERHRASGHKKFVHKLGFPVAFDIVAHEPQMTPKEQREFLRTLCAYVNIVINYVRDGGAPAEMQKRAETLCDASEFMRRFRAEVAALSF